MAKAKLRKRHLNNDIDKLDDIACDLWAAVQHIRRIKPVAVIQAAAQGAGSCVACSGWLE